MKNAVQYQNVWLTKTSKAFELYELWKKSAKPAEQKKVLDAHMKQLNEQYKVLHGSL